MIKDEMRREMKELGTDDYRDVLRNHDEYDSSSDDELSHIDGLYLDFNDAIDYLKSIAPYFVIDFWERILIRHDHDIEAVRKTIHNANDIIEKEKTIGIVSDHERRLRRIIKKLKIKYDGFNFAMRVIENELTIEEKKKWDRQH